MLVKSSVLSLCTGALLGVAVLAEDKVTPSDSEKKTQSNPEKVRPATDVLNTGQETSTDQSKDADNTARNKRDRNDATLTPGDQGNTKEDIEVTRQIRRALVKDKSLSTTAKNVKIITKEGKVTLRGPVKTEAEKLAIVAKAKEVATSAHPVTDEIEVKIKSETETELESKSKASEPRR
jgi:osmotically-inducible protein OsmY